MDAGFTGTQVGCKAPQVDSLRRVVRALAPIAAGILTFHHGDCIGGDETLHGVVRELGHRIELHPPLNWSKRAWCTLRDGEVAHEPAEYIPCLSGCHPSKRARRRSKRRAGPAGRFYDRTMTRQIEHWDRQ